MNYPEELREKWNDLMYDERDIIEEFLKKQYDLRYGRQRDSWHFEDEIEVVSSQGSLVKITDIMLDKDCFVKFHVKAFGHDYSWWECSNFAYGELSKIIEVLPDADDIVFDNAVKDLKRQNLNLRLDLLLAESPFQYGDGKDMVMIDGFGDDTNKIITELAISYGKDFVVKLRDHINIEYLHRTNEYKTVMEFLSLEPNLRKSVDEYTKTHYGSILFTLEGTDLEFDVSAIQRDDNGNLTIFGADTCCEDELITLTEKDIRKEYLEVVLRWLTARSNIMDTYNGHNNELVRKINAAWRSEKYHDSFSEILVALSQRDHHEFEDKFDTVVEADGTWAMNHAHEIMEGVCDDWDLETILSFIRYKED